MKIVSVAKKLTKDCYEMISFRISLEGQLT